MNSWHDFPGPNAGFVLELYDRFRQDPLGAQTASVRDALRLGCVAVGYTIYPGTAERRLQYEQLRELVEEAKAAGLAVVVWSYPRGGGLSKDGEMALDVTAYAAHIAAQLGAHIIKIKLPTAHLELEVIGRNSFQRDRLATLRLLDHMIRIYKGETP